MTRELERLIPIKFPNFEFFEHVMPDNWSSRKRNSHDILLLWPEEKETIKMGLLSSSRVISVPENMKRKSKCQPIRLCFG